MTAIVYYNVHHNWEWVLYEALSSDKFNWNALNIKSAITSSSRHHCKRLRELPSQKSNNPNEKPTYSLLRVEINSLSVWATSTAFTRLDSKDYLYCELTKYQTSHTMPLTSLIDYDITNADNIPDIPHLPCYLKAACGSGGFGIYKVSNKPDILSIIQYHAKKAQEHKGFIDSLLQQYHGSIPQWSLQAFIPSVKVNDNRRCQVRAYVVYCNSKLYLYNTLEVRLPYWNETALSNETDETAPSETDARKLVYDYELACCAGTTCIPYNKHRLKECTERYLLCELSEISHTDSIVKACVIEAMTALKPSILETDKGHNYDQSPNLTPTSSNRSTLAICGIDVILYYDSLNTRTDTSTQHLTDNTNITDIHASTSSGNSNSPSGNSSTPSGTYNIKAKILELNNNPAITHPNKHMSILYRQHLIDFVGNIVELGLRHSKGSELLPLDSENLCNFTKIW